MNYSADDITELKRKLYQAQEIYNNTGEELITDEEFDALSKLYEYLTGEEFKPIGAEPNEKSMKLPIPGPSLDKIKDKKGHKTLLEFLSRFEADLVDMDKYDGVSVIVEYTGTEIICQKRGNGEIAPNISFIQNYIPFPQIGIKAIIRGELFLLNEDFELLKPELIESGNKANNARSVVSGALNVLGPNPTVISKCKFIPYSLYIRAEDSQYGGPLTKSTQLEYLKMMGFTIPNYIKLTKQEATFDFLMSYLDKRRNEIKYTIDGTVLIFDIPEDIPTENKNPRHAIAIKKDTIEFTTVIGCEFRFTSKDGYLTPVIQVKPVVVITEVSNITLNNGSLLIKNKISPGAVIAITQGGDVIPKFLWTVEEGNGIIFSPNIEFKWNPSGIELMVTHPERYPQVKCCQMKYFLSMLGVKKLGLTTIWKLYHIGITNIGKLIRVTIPQLIEADRIGEDLATGIIEELHKGIKAATMPRIMAGSNIFGEGISEITLKKFINAFPNWRYINIKYEDLRAVRDFGPFKAKNITDNLPAFKEWLTGLPELEGIITEQVVRKSNALAGFSFYFTGFTDNRLKQEIESYGGTVTDNFVKTNNVVVRKDSNYSSSKVSDALASGGKIKLYSRIELENEMRKFRMTL